MPQADIFITGGGMFLFLSIFTGFMVSLMIQLNGILQTAAGGVNALLTIHLSGLAGALLFFLLFRRRLPGDKSKHSPYFCLGAGAVGTLIVYLASVSFEKGGILLSLSGSLAGQTLAAAVAEQLSRNRHARSPLLQRILSPALLIPGSVVIGLKADVAIIWILVSWTPGILLMIQQTMNAKNTARYGTPATVVFNYISALAVIIPMFIIIGAGKGWAAVPSGGNLLPVISGLPPVVIIGGGLIGVFTTGSIAFMLLKAPALMVVLGIYAGELAGGIMLDLVSGNPVAPEKMIGILLIAAGLASSKLRLKQVKSQV